VIIAPEMIQLGSNVEKEREVRMQNYAYTSTFLQTATSTSCDMYNARGQRKGIGKADRVTM